ncbi:MAG: CBS domain-containing protein [Idiomarina sp.]|nr:CBS domain-containing protein [Idiomarina sp.]
MRPALFIVRSGVFDLRGADGRLIERLESGDLFGYPSLLSGREVVNKLQTKEDGIVYVLPQSAFDRLRNASKPFEQYFIRAHGQRLLTEQKGEDSTVSDWSEQTIGSVVTMAPVSTTSDTSVQQAAKLMTQHGISSVLIVDDNQLIGILTDRDLRNRVVAEGLPLDVRVSAVMTQLPESVYENRSLMDALTTMTSSNIHHLPVVNDQNQPVGMVTATDLIRQQRSDPVFLISAIRKANSKAQLIEEAKKLPDYLQTFASRVKQTSVLGRLMASVTDGMTRQLIQLYEQENGAAPAAYSWLAFGSQGREDQTLSSDQDNGLLLSNGLTDKQQDWFAGLGPTPKALMYCQIFFDSRPVVGPGKFYQQYRTEIANLAKNEMFLGNLAILVNRISVPLGLFNRLRTEDTNDGDTIDIKRYGIALINDIARIYSLQGGITSPATPARLAALKGSKLLNRQDNQSLLEAWEFLTQLRLNHQLKVWGTDKPKNAIDPDELSTLSRRQLKSAFKIIKEAQQGVGLKFSRQGY